jgi:hypothetical protein
MNMYVCMYVRMHVFMYVCAVLARGVEGVEARISVRNNYCLMSMFCSFKYTLCCKKFRIEVADISELCSSCNSAV